MKVKSDFDEFAKDIEEHANKIHLKKAIATERKGKAKLRDRLVFGKISWAESLSYISIIQSIIIFTALIPDSVGTVNGFLDWLGIPFQFPVEMASIGAVIFIIIVFIFGLIAVRHIGTVKRATEISSKMNPSMFMLWDQQKEILSKLEVLEGKK